MQKLGGIKKSTKKIFECDTFVSKQINGKDRGDSMLLFVAAYANPQYADFEKYLSKEERKVKKLLFAHIAFDLGKASSISDESDKQFQIKQGLSDLEQIANDPSKPSYEQVDAQNTLAESGSN